MMGKIKFNEPYLTGLEQNYIKDVFKENSYYGNGKYSKLATKIIKSKLRTENVLLTDSCTSALEIVALLLKDWSCEQEVILPSYTFSSTASAFARAGYKLVFAEIDPATMMLDASDVERKVSDKTVAIVAVHYGGYCADLIALQAICAKKAVNLVEDAAQAFDSHIEGNALGTIGDFGCFSFHETKNIHAGLAGALTIKDDSLLDRATCIWERGTNRQEVLKGLADKYSWVEIGGSFYPTELQAAFLYAQLESLDENKRQRAAVYEAYLRLLQPLKEKGVIAFPEYSQGYESNYHAFFVIFNSEAECDKVREFLCENQVSAYIGYVPLHSSAVGQRMGYKAESLPITEEYAKRVLRLPFHNNLTSEQVFYITKLIGEALI